MRDHHRGRAAVAGEAVLQPGDCLQKHQLGNGWCEQVRKVGGNPDVAEVTDQLGRQINAQRPILRAVEQAIVRP
ncbi:hypothetical protein D3C86_1262120 [compost metagenome]